MPHSKPIQWHQMTISWLGKVERIIGLHIAIG